MIGVYVAGDSAVHRARPGVKLAVLLAATTALLGPVAISLAQLLDLPPTPFVVCTALGAVVAFLTPIGHHGNLLILGPGQYRFGDFLRIGLPLTIAIALVSAWMARWLWLDGPLWPALA